jgi:hypothetical protein
MTSKTDIINRALQAIGTRTTVTDAQVANNTTNEAKQANIAYDNVRKRLLRMAPWNCALKTANLVYITSVPGTPENTSSATTLWERGQPTPPWAYEYQYPNDCLDACWILPATQTGYAGGVPITTAVTGGAPSFWRGPPVKFAVQTDLFKAVTAAAVVAGGTGYAVGDQITLPIGPNTSAPIGAPVVLQVATLSGSAVATVTVVSQVIDSATPLGGSYFDTQTGTIAQDTTTGSGTGATFTLTQASTATPQRVILCNQEFATLVYTMDVTDPNLFDDLFQTAFASVLGAVLSIPLGGDKTLAKLAIGIANDAIMQARAQDGNEGLSINDVTPDWIRVRGIDFVNPYSGPYQGYDWGGVWSW